MIDAEDQLSWESYKDDVYGFVDAHEEVGYNFKPMMERDYRRWQKADSDNDDKLNKEEDPVPGKAEVDNRKRDDYLEWSEYFMAVSFLSAMRSKDPATQVGACIVNPEKRIVGIGYNGMPRGCSDDLLPWGKNSKEE